MEKIPLNLTLLSNPINWAIVWTMVLFASVGLYIISSYAKPSSAA